MRKPRKPAEKKRKDIDIFECSNGEVSIDDILKIIPDNISTSDIKIGWSDYEGIWCYYNIPIDNEKYKKEIEQKYNNEMKKNENRTDK